jgi:hypothetical protein
VTSRDERTFRILAGLVIIAGLLAAIVLLSC